MTSSPSPIIARAAHALHVMEAMQDPRLSLGFFTARIEGAAEETTGIPREDLTTEAEFLKATDEWVECATDPGTGPEDPRPIVEAHPIDPDRVLSDLALLSAPRTPKVLHGRLIGTAPQTTGTEEDYVGLLAGVMHLRDTVWSYA